MRNRTNEGLNNLGTERMRDGTNDRVHRLHTVRLALLRCKIDTQLGGFLLQLHDTSGGLSWHWQKIHEKPI
jgi:hypothetical protein